MDTKNCKIYVLCQLEDTLFIHCATSYLARLGHVGRISGSFSAQLPEGLTTLNSGCDFQPQNTQAQTAPLKLTGSVKGPLPPFRLYDKYHRPGGL